MPTDVGGDPNWRFLALVWCLRCFSARTCFTPIDHQKSPLSHQKSAIFYQKRPVFYQKSFVFYENVCILVWCLQWCSASTCQCVVSKEPFILSKELYILSKKPYILSKEPYILSKEPYILSKTALYSKYVCVSSRWSIIVYSLQRHKVKEEIEIEFVLIVTEYISTSFTLTWSNLFSLWQNIYRSCYIFFWNIRKKIEYVQQ